MARRTAVRLLVGVGLAVVLGACVATLVHGDAYQVDVELANAGGLVKGGLVTVAGRKVGSIEDIDVTDDGHATVRLGIQDSGVTPLREGARAAVRSLGQAGITNRFVDLTLGPSSGAKLPSGGSIPLSRTTSVVALDALLDAFGPRQREDLRRLIASSSEAFAGSGGARFNAMLGRLNPALVELDGLTGELARDRASVEQVIDRGAVTATALASRQADLGASIDHTATVMEAVAQDRAALAGTLDRAPGVLAQATGTLRATDRTVRDVRPTLRAVPAVAGPLDTLLGRSVTVLPRATPVVQRLARQLPAVQSSLTGLVALRPVANRALASATRALVMARPILRGARFYGSDFVLGILNGLVGAGSYNYDRFGHYQRLDFIQPPQTSIAGPGSKLFQGNDLIPGVIGIRTGLTRRCPGGNVPPAIDGSTPWVPDPSLCTPDHDTPASVNGP